MNIIDRIIAPTPKFFKGVRMIGLILAAISAPLLASPVAMPNVVIKIAGYLAVAGSVATAIGQIATKEDITITKTGNKQSGISKNKQE